MKQLTLVAAMVTLVLGGVAQAGSSQFAFTFSDPVDGITASGVLVATDNGGGQFTATSVINGKITGNPGGNGALTLIANPNAPGGSATFGQVTYDDFLFPSQGVTLDTNGLFFSVPNGNTLNIFFALADIAPEYELADSDSAGNGTFLGALTPSFTLTPVTAVPEPSSLCLLGIGAAGLVACRKQKRS
jgi:hypothetical protein